MQQELTNGGEAYENGTSQLNTTELPPPGTDYQKTSDKARFRHAQAKQINNNMAAPR